MLELRPYQIEFREAIRGFMLKGHRAILGQAPTGAGKTVVVADMARTAAARGLAVWFIVHRRELVRQSTAAFALAGVRHGVIASGFPEDPAAPVQIASIGTLARRYEKIVPPGLIIWDECHHVAAGSWSRIFNGFPKAFHIGLTATPERLDGKGLSKWFTAMARGPSVSWLIENGYLSKYKLYAPTTINVSEVHSRMGDFVRSELSAVVDQPTITGDVIREYQKLANGKRTIVFCVSIEHSKHVVDRFRQAGISAAHVDGETHTDERDLLIRKFKEGSIDVISNVQLFGEGFDVPAIECVIDICPTQSLSMYLQRMGRALRASPGKDFAVILDHAGNALRHGLPDEERPWSLNGRERRKKGASDLGPSVRICPQCFAAQLPGRADCAFCGHNFKVESRSVQEMEGDLELIDKEKLAEQRAKNEAKKKRGYEQFRADSLEKLVDLAIARGYKKPERWAAHIMASRKKKQESGI